MPRYLCPADRLMTADRVSSATSERGSAIRQGPVPDSTNVGSLTMWAEHTLPDVTPVALLMSLEAGGNPEGYIPGGPTVTAGARLSWALGSETTAEQRGWIDRPFTRYADTAAPSSSVTSFSPPSIPVQTHDGRLGFVTLQDSSTDLFVYKYKATRFADWSSVTISDNSTATLQVNNLTARPGLLITDSGRLIAYAPVASPYGGASSDNVAAWYSDDHGDTWAVLADAVTTYVGEINVAWISGSAIMLQGLDAYVSTSEGVSFTATGSGTTPAYSRPTMVVMGGKVIVVVDDGSSNLYLTSVAPGGNIDDANDYRAITEVSGGQWKTLVVGDQGDLWIFVMTSATAGAVHGFVSQDAGASWVQIGPDPTSVIFSSDTSNSNTLESMAAGMLGADMVLLGRSNVSTTGTSGADGQIQALYLGGWNRSFSEESITAAWAGETYQAQYLPITVPDTVSWTKTDVGAGATREIFTGRFKITATATNNSDFTAPSTFDSNTSGWRLRFVVGVDSGGSVANPVARVRVRNGGQWLEIRFSAGQIRAQDNSGALATDTPVGGTAGPVEFLVTYEKNGGTGGTVGLATVLYRFQAGGDLQPWQALISAQDIADDGVSTGQEISMGGTSAAAAVWFIHWLAAAGDNYGINRDADGRGRALSRSHAMHLYSGLSVGGNGTSGVQGDGYTLSAVAAFPGAMVWASPSPGEQAQSADDTAAWRIVFDAGTVNRFKGDTVMVFGTNWLTATVDANASDSWGSPTVSDSLSTAIVTYGLSVSGVGGAALATSSMIPHEYASKAGARYFCRFATSGTTYEIADNSDGYLFIDADVSSEAGDVTIFMDKGWTALTGYGTAGYRYMSINVPVQDTADGWFSLGVLLPAHRVTMNAGDGSDAAWGWSRGTKTPTEIQSASDGYQAVQVIGGPQGVVVMPMLESMAAVRDWSAEVVALVRYLDGPGSLVGLVIDSALSHLHRNGGLYRLGSSTAREVRVYGTDGSTDLKTVGTLNLLEVK